MAASGSVTKASTNYQQLVSIFQVLINGNVVCRNVYGNDFGISKATLQTQQVYSTLKRRGNGRFHVVSTWNPRDVFIGKFSKCSESC